MENCLLFFPLYWVRAHEDADQALYGRYGRPFDSVGRGSGTNDPTARRGIAYAEAREELQRLALVRPWIDERLPPADRPLLIDVWRYHKYGWRWVAKHVGLEAIECRERWDKLTGQLNGWMNSRKVSAGTACGRAGPAYVGFQGNAGLA